MDIQRRQKRIQLQTSTHLPLVYVERERISAGKENHVTRQPGTLSLQEMGKSGLGTVERILVRKVSPQPPQQQRFLPFGNKIKRALA